MRHVFAQHLDGLVPWRGTSATSPVISVTDALGAGAARRSARTCARIGLANVLMRGHGAHGRRHVHTNFTHAADELAAGAGRHMTLAQAVHTPGPCVPIDQATTIVGGGGGWGNAFTTRFLGRARGGPRLKVVRKGDADAMNPSRTTAVEHTSARRAVFILATFSQRIHVVAVDRHRPPTTT